MNPIITFIFLIAIVSCHRNVDLLQRDVPDKKLAQTQTSHAKEFPDDWLGYWVGELNIYNENGLSMTVPIALDHQKTDVDSAFTWAIIYGEDTISGRRDYMLHVIDQSKGHYLIDEKNGILLDAYMLDNSLISTFKVQGNYLQSIYELDGENMYFTIHFFSEKEVRTSGGIEFNDEEIPIVFAYKNTVMQKANLKKLR